VEEGEKQVITNISSTLALQKVCELELKSYQSCKTFEWVRTGNLFLDTMGRVERNLPIRLDQG